ncbi:D-malate degradation protein R [Delftia tsuruhatensis]|uniref:LysR family transcriptional regulator n=1 Tax=Delftia tsuruhatensis TaxID=180282 RepID=UPI001E77B7F2|nr:LysR family transcriptional regulator [Delftia tsuruhatensis]CAB5717556.1 D-malate degradation protein R [Delftia tsuruhatensis]CAC9686300.1 D-malate degradation protein R [Delftia tsuruhatensis]
MDGFSDLRFFSLLIREGSLAATAQQMGVTPPAVSRRLALLERRLGVRLLQRTTRRIHLTPEGQAYLLEGTRILADLDSLERSVSGARATARGPLALACTLGFGRQRLAPALSAFARSYPEVQVQLHLTDRPVNLVEQGFDAVVRFGNPPDSALTARLLLPNRRVLCAAPSYLDVHGEPRQPADLQAHRCIVIRESDDTYGSWRLGRRTRQGLREETVKVHGALSSNDGSTALAWALDGQGIVQRSLWEAAAPLASGRLRQVLPQWHLPAADIYLVHATRSEMSAKIRALTGFLGDWFAQEPGTGAAPP